jgi:hypothetical protein
MMSHKKGKKSKEYQVTKGETLLALTALVKVLMDEGWKCQGGVAQGANYYLQAMVK